MKLYLSSYKLGSETNKLKKWAEEKDNKIGLIINARDIYPDGERKTSSILKDVNALEELGFEVLIVDLKNYFNKPEMLFSELKTISAFFAIGGNCFVLRQAMKLSGFDDFLKHNVNNKNFLYGGYSAGICVLAPSLKGIELVDDITANPYNHPTILEGLGLINYFPVPHYDSDNPESELMYDVVNYFEKESINYKTLRDGDVIVKNL